MAQSYVQLASDGTGKKMDTQVTATAAQHRQVMALGDPSTDVNVAAVTAANALKVDISSTGANGTAIKVDGSAVTQPVSAASLPLPTGAATAANQTSANTSLSTIATNLPAQGQALAAASLPVVLTAAQVTTLTPPSSVGLNAGTSLIGKVGIDQTTPGTTNKVSIGTDGTVALNAALPTGTNSIGQVTANAGTNLNTSALALETGGNLATVVTNTNKIPSKGAATTANSTPVNLASDQGVLTAPIFVTDIPNTTGGWTPKSITALAATVTGVKASAAGTMGGYQIGNPNATVTYIQVFDLATTGAVTLGTTTPTYVFSIPGNATATVGGGGNVEFSKGINHANGIQVAATTTPTGLTAPTNTLCALFLYK